MSTTSGGDALTMTGAESPVPSTRSLRRKPVPTPRNTLKKPSVVCRKHSADQDSQGQTSNDSTSPDESSAGEKGEKSDDILAALEKIPGVGTLRSGASSSGGSLPSLTSNADNPRISSAKREDSSHSLSVGKQNGAGTGDHECAEANKKRFNTERIRPKAGKLTAEEEAMSKKFKVECELTRLGRASDGQEEAEEEKDSKTTSLSEQRKSVIQARPLPELPLAMATAGKASASSPEEEDIVIISPDHYCELQLKEDTEKSTSAAAAAATTTEAKPLLATRTLGRKLPPRPPETNSLLGVDKQNYLTLTGTMKRASRLKLKKSISSTASAVSDASQQQQQQQQLQAQVEDKKEPVYDVHLNMTQDNLIDIEKKVHAKYHDRCFCGLQRGPHVFLLSLITIPLALIYATLMGFYLGTLTWYNVFLHFNEDRGCCYKLLSPFVLLAYPFWIVPVTIGLGVYGGFAQISWYFDSWLAALQAPDGGFFAWICDFIGMPEECSPYQVILLAPGQSDYERPCTGATIL